MFKKMILFTLSSLFLLVGVLGSSCYSLYQTFFDYDELQSLIEQHELFDLLHETIEKQVIMRQEELLEPGSPLLFSSDEIADLLDEALPISWLNQQSASILDDIDNWMRSDEPDFDIILNIGKQKEDFSTAIIDALEQKEENIPECTPEQMLEASETSQVNLTCLPPGTSLEQFLGPDGYGFIEEFTSILPDRLSLRHVVEGRLVEDLKIPEEAVKTDETRSEHTNKEAAMSYQEIMQALRLVRLVMFWTKTALFIAAVVEAYLLFSMIMLTYRDLKLLLRWIALPFLKLGASLWLTIGLGKYGLDKLKPNLETALPDSVDPRIRDLLTDLVINLSQKMLTTLTYFASAALAIAIIALFALFYVRIKAKHKAKMAL